MELALKDAFKNNNLDKDAQVQLNNEYYLFKKATLKWRLFKQYAEMTGVAVLRYKTYWYAMGESSTCGIGRVS